MPSTKKPSASEIITSWRVLVGTGATVVVVLVSVLVAGWRAREASAEVAQNAIQQYMLMITPVDARQDRELSELKAQIGNLMTLSTETRIEIGRLREDFYKFVTGNAAAIKPPSQVP